MADYPHITCPTCGANRPMEKFGLDSNGQFDPDAAPSYPLNGSVKHTGAGYKGIQWSRGPLPLAVVRGLRQRMKSEVDSIDAILFTGYRLGCLACGGVCDPEDMAIIDGQFDPEQAQTFNLVLLEPSTDDNGATCWKPVDDCSPLGGRRSVAIAILKRLEWVAKQWRQALVDDEG
jgi:hypothetical protein